MISNREFSEQFSLMAKLMELHGENAFKLRSYQNAAFRINRLRQNIYDLGDEELSGLDGIGKGIIQKIHELIENGSIAELENLIAKTPAGVIEMMGVKGIGPKKIAVIWKELGIESPGELLYACYENRLIDLKGFGKKTQEQIIKSIEFGRENKNKFHYASVEGIAEDLIARLREIKSCEKIESCGDLRRKSIVLEYIKLITVLSNRQIFEKNLNEIFGDVLYDKEHEHFHMKYENIPVWIFISDDKKFVAERFIHSAATAHVEQLQKLLKKPIESSNFSDEKEIYSSINIQFIPAEMREGIGEIELATENKIPELVVDSDLKGILHNHTTYSDGLHSLREMAIGCRDLGYQYLGICDHSKSAFYANGLQAERIEEQHREIDLLNEELKPFHIFKGIESDILNNGALDYDDEVLATFDLVVASVHSNLKMDIDKATERLITAIENPFTTILGHPTGRLLLAREGYPIDYKKVIDACAENGVVIELNAHPYRLDIDWSRIPYALEKGVMISINPDAHQIEGYGDMHFGVCAARKGGLPASMTFNALSLESIREHFEKRTARALSGT